MVIQNAETLRHLKEALHRCGINKDPYSDKLIDDRAHYRNAIKDIDDDVVADIATELYFTVKKIVDELESQGGVMD